MSDSTAVSNGLLRGDCLPMQEAQHRVANHLAGLAGLIRLHATQIAKSDRAPSKEEMLLLLGNIGAHAEGNFSAQSNSRAEQSGGRRPR